jgi:uncharacterized membrane protein YkoI
MNKRTWIIIGVAVLLLAAGIGAYVVSRQSGGHWRPSPGAGATANGSRVLVQGQQVMELARALEIADTHVHGEVLKVELERDDDRFVYEIKVLADNGRVQEIKLDAHTGGLIKIEDD